MSHSPKYDEIYIFNAFEKPLKSTVATLKSTGGLGPNLTGGEAGSQGFGGTPSSGFGSLWGTVAAVGPSTGKGVCNLGAV
jgi:hypothetical protein